MIKSVKINHLTSWETRQVINGVPTQEPTYPWVSFSCSAQVCLSCRYCIVFEDSQERFSSSFCLMLKGSTRNSGCAKLALFLLLFLFCFVVEGTSLLVRHFVRWPVGLLIGQSGAFSFKFSKI